MERLTRPTVDVDVTAAKYMAAPGTIPTDLRSMSDRLLDLVINGPTLNGVNKDVLRQLIRQLYAALKPYEDTGLEPEQIEDNMEMFKAYRSVCAGMPPEFIAELLELSKARAEGRLVVLPCKVGDVLYDIMFGEIKEKTVVSGVFMLSQSVNRMAVHARNERGATTEVELWRLGKTVFLTREEAERALEGGTDNA